MRQTLATVLVIAACETPPLSLRFKLTPGDTQACVSDTGNQTTSCSDVTMLCQAYLSIRIVPPGDPDVPYISVCKPLVGAQNKLCSIAGIDLPEPTVPVPEQILEVQMAVFPRDALVDPMTGDVRIDSATGEAVCPIVEFAANGFPIAATSCAGECPPRPAVGGRTFYYPGDDQTIVELGCTDLELLRGATCTGANRISVSATVTDFDTGATVTGPLADRLTVSIGEPEPVGSAYALDPADVRELERTVIGPTPVWSAELTDITFGTAKCIQVLEDGPQATSSLTCLAISASDADRIDMGGIRLARATLTQLLAALGKPIFPDEGLVVGVVLDSFGNPASGASLTASAGTVQYLSADRMSVNTTSTSSNGIFVSQNAPFGSTFTWSATLRSGFGGLVDGRVTVVVIRENMPIGN